MSHKPKYFFLSLLFLGMSFFMFQGCDSSDINTQSSISSGTTSGSGGSGGTPANVTVIAGNSTIAYGSTTSITVVVTDAVGGRTDASLILTSSAGGTFNGTTYSILNSNTSNGILIADFTPSSSGDTEIAATIAGTIIRGSTIITVY